MKVQCRLQLCLPLERTKERFINTSTINCSDKNKFDECTNILYFIPTWLHIRDTNTNSNTYKKNLTSRK